ncbi:expressed unknown protein [Seminavis robusta]|uniref:HSF-type DNA-binding domain-containing protein n=1 Tax=Seminavis robusta TaxID=568900 RepID=A0A9N8DA86_9STRA|nr:expressed unknown protein [Seminavis robusta]|eukprot:Sro14_g010390.1 n/a (1511) ;mRNA; r:8651-13458
MEEARAKHNSSPKGPGSKVLEVDTADNINGLVGASRNEAAFPTAKPTSQDSQESKKANPSMEAESIPASKEESQAAQVISTEQAEAPQPENDAIKIPKDDQAKEEKGNSEEAALPSPVNKTDNKPSDASREMADKNHSEEGGKDTMSLVTLQKELPGPEATEAKTAQEIKPATKTEGSARPGSVADPTVGSDEGMAIDMTAREKKKHEDQEEVAKSHQEDEETKANPEEEAKKDETEEMNPTPAAEKSQAKAGKEAAEVMEEEPAEWCNSVQITALSDVKAAKPDEEGGASEPETPPPTTEEQPEPMGDIKPAGEGVKAAVEAQSETLEKEKCKLSDEGEKDEQTTMSTDLLEAMSEEEPSNEGQGEVADADLMEDEVVIDITGTSEGISVEEPSSEDDAEASSKAAEAQFEAKSEDIVDVTSVGSEIVDRSDRPETNEVVAKDTEALTKAEGLPETKPDDTIEMLDESDRTQSNEEIAEGSEAGQDEEIEIEIDVTDVIIEDEESSDETDEDSDDDDEIDVTDYGVEDRDGDDAASASLEVEIDVTGLDSDAEAKDEASTRAAAATDNTELKSEFRENSRKDEDRGRQLTPGNSPGERSKRPKRGNSPKSRVPLHRLMVDYKERKPNWEKECRVEGSRKSARPKKAPDNFVAGPASMKKSTDRAERKKLKQMEKRQKKRNQRRLMGSLQRKKDGAHKPRLATMSYYPGYSRSRKEDESDSWQDDIAKCRKKVGSNLPTLLSMKVTDRPDDPTKSLPLLPDLPLPSASPSATEAQPEKEKSTNPNPLTSVGSSIVANPAHIPSAPKPKVAGKVLSAKFEMTKRPKKRRPKMAWEIYQEQRLSEQCLGKTFPEQLMLLMNSSVASGKMWWTADGGGKTFAFDLAFFKDDVMNMFFPPNHLRRITVMLTRWEFKRVMQPDLPKHFLAYQHPKFDRFKPEMASEIVLKCKGAFELALEREEEDRRRLFQGIRKQREQGDGMLLPVHKSAAAVEQFISNSMRKVEQGRKEKGLDKILFQQRTHPLQRKQVTKAVRPRVKKPEKARVPPSVLIASLRRDESHGHDKASVAPPSVRIAALRRDCPPKNDATATAAPSKSREPPISLPATQPNKSQVTARKPTTRPPERNIFARLEAARSGSTGKEPVSRPSPKSSSIGREPISRAKPASSVKKAPPPPASVEIIDVDAPTPEPSRDINRGKRRKNSIRLPPRPVQPAVAVAVAEPPRPEQHGFERRSAQSGLHLRQSHILRGKAIPTTLANLQQTPRKRLGMTWDDPSLGTPDSAESPKKTNELAQRLANNRDVGTNSIRRTSLASSRRLSAQEQVALAEEQRALKRQKQMLEEELVLTRHRMQTNEQQHLVGRDTEAARRRRLASALYGTSKPTSKPEAPAAPKPPASPSGESSRKKTMKASDPPIINNMTSQRAAAVLSPAAAAIQHRHLQQQQQQQHQAAMAVTHMDQLMLLRQQQAMAMNNMYVAGNLPPGAPFAIPGQGVAAVPADPSLEQMILMRRMGRR